MPLTVCIAEDRTSCEPALRVLVASLARHCPGLPGVMFCPNASPGFISWITTYPQFHLNPVKLEGTWTKYDIKPRALLSVLRGTGGSVLWIDSDVLITRDFRRLFSAIASNFVAVGEEALCSGRADPDGLRARLWGMAVGRTMPFTLNTGVVRVSPQHTELLEQWNGLLQSEPYRAAQELPWDQRGLHVMGDQEVFTALLASDQFASLPIRFLHRGADIIQFFGSSGYTLRERLGHLLNGLPYFIHSQGFRPWWPNEAPASGWSARFTSLYNELSPYTAAARDYADALEDPAWLRPRSVMARAILWMTGKCIPLSGLPLATAADLTRGFRFLVRIRT
jgi:hypothetical protein